MKSLVKIFVLLCTVLFLHSCEVEIQSFSFDSPDKDRRILISGDQAGFLDPIMVSVTLEVPGGTKTFQFEHQSTDLNQENVSINWANNSHAVLLFKLPDGTYWEVDCFLMDNRVEAVKRIKMDNVGIFE